MSNVYYRSVLTVLFYQFDHPQFHVKPAREAEGRYEVFHGVAGGGGGGGGGGGVLPDPL